MFNTMFKSRKNLSTVINNNKTPMPVLKLNIIGHIVIIALFAMAITDYLVSDSEFRDISTNIQLLKSSYIRVAELENIISKILHLELLNIGISAYNTTKYTAATIETAWKANISQSINTIGILLFPSNFL